nr:hypothetical protein [Tanacetum cinerariifolium]
MGLNGLATWVWGHSNMGWSGEVNGTVQVSYSVQDDQSLFDEDFLKEIYSNPLFDEEIIYMKIDPHHFNAESDLIESLLNHDSSIISSSSKIDSLFDEFAGELALLKSISPGIDEIDCDPEHEIRLTKRLLYDNSSPRPPEEVLSENSNANIESFYLSPISEDDYDSERDILILKELLDNYSLSLPENKSFHFDTPSSSRPPTKPPDGNTGRMPDDDPWKEHSYLGCSSFLFLSPLISSSMGELGQAQRPKTSASWEAPHAYPYIPKNLKTLAKGFCLHVFISSSLIRESYTMFELVKICQEKEFLCIHDDINDLIESALDFKLLLINSNSQRLEKKEQEVKNVVEKPAGRRNHDVLPPSDDNDDDLSNDSLLGEADLFLSDDSIPPGTGNSFTYDTIPESFDEVQIIPNLPPQCHFNIYLCQICESNSHYGYECSQRVLLVYEPEPCYTKNFSDNYYSHDLPGVNPLIDHHCCYKCGNSLNDFFCHQCTCEFCGNGAHVGYNCPSQVPSTQTLSRFPQQYPCCEDCGGLPEADHCQPPQYTVNQPIFNAHKDLLNSQNKSMEQMTSMCEMIPACYDDDDDYNFAITPNEPVNSLKMGDEHLDTVSAIESDEFIKSSDENIVSNPSESEGENKCDVPACFTTFSNILFDADYDFYSVSDQSLSDEDFQKKSV